jgi:hypothetical protein
MVTYDQVDLKLAYFYGVLDGAAIVAVEGDS